MIDILEIALIHVAKLREFRIRDQEARIAVLRRAPHEFLQPRDFLIDPQIGLKIDQALLKALAGGEGLRCAKHQR